MINITEDVQNMDDEIVSIRRTLHQIPEAGFAEYKTSAYIKNFLSTLDIEVYDQIAQTGIVGVLKGTEGKRTLAFRADMDALPVVEQNPFAFVSQHPGYMHACGHDAHITIVLSLAKYVAEHKNQVKDNLVFIFQPAEEGPGGAELIVKENILKKFQVNAVYGLHLFPDLEEGKIGVRSGAMMAQSGEFEVMISGKGGHGAMPHKAIDAIVIAADLIQSFQTIISRTISPVDPALITIGKIEGGERLNIIAEKVILEGTIRAFDEAVFDWIKAKMHLFSQSLELAYGCQIDLVFRDLYPPVVNDKSLCDEFIRIFDQEDVEIVEPQMISEDFAYYQREIPGLFFFLGIRNEAKGFTAPLHSAKFNFDEKILAQGVQILIDVLKYKKAIKKD